MELRTFTDDELEGHVRLLAGDLDLRRDLHKLLCFVRDRGITRTKRGNDIPKVAARRLAKLLSCESEAADVELCGSGHWSDFVCERARLLGLVSYDVEGSYAGYSSSEPSYPDNVVVLQEEAWQAWLRRSPLDKERALADVLLKHEPSELFHRALLVGGEHFDIRGSATGPAKRMDLPRIRRTLLDLLATLEPETWYDTRDLVSLLEARHPDLVIDPAKLGPDDASLRKVREWEWEKDRIRYRRDKKAKPGPRPELVTEDRYNNFREYAAGESRWDPGSKRQLDEQTPGVFRRVEGRYLEFFLRQVPYLLGFVDLAWRPDDDPHGLDVTPPLERLAAVRLSPRFFAIWKREAALNEVAVTVLPNLEVIVEAPSYPDVVLDALEPYTRTLSEDGPIHRLRLERKRVVSTIAEHPEAPPPSEVLVELSGAPLPGNVAVELASWSRRGSAVVIYEGLGLLELSGKRSEALAPLDGLVQAQTPSGIVLLRQPERAMAALEEAQLAPVQVRHKTGFARCGGKLGTPSGKPRARKPSRPKPSPVRLVGEDTVCYRAANPALLKALHEALRGQASTCVLLPDGSLLLSAVALPGLRAALRKVRDRFDVTVT